MLFSNQENDFVSHGPFDWLGTKEERNIFYEGKQKVENEKRVVRCGGCKFVCGREEGVIGEK